MRKVCCSMHGHFLAHGWQCRNQWLILQFDAERNLFQPRTPLLQLPSSLVPGKATHFVLGREKWRRVFFLLPWHIIQKLGFGIADLRSSGVFGGCSRSCVTIGCWTSPQNPMWSHLASSNWEIHTWVWFNVMSHSDSPSASVLRTRLVFDLLDCTTVLQVLVDLTIFFFTNTRKKVGWTQQMPNKRNS